MTCKVPGPARKLLLENQGLGGVAPVHARALHPPCQGCHSDGRVESFRGLHAVIRRAGGAAVPGREFRVHGTARGNPAVFIALPEKGGGWGCKAAQPARASSVVSPGGCAHAVRTSLSPLTQEGAGVGDGAAAADAVCAAAMGPGLHLWGPGARSPLGLWSGCLKWRPVCGEGGGWQARASTAPGRRATPRAARGRRSTPRARPPIPAGLG